jgi:hypothetical protein
MQTILKLDRMRYTLKSPERVDEVTQLYNKFAKTRRKPVTGGCSRTFPKNGELMSTAVYVTEYMMKNSLEYRDVDFQLTMFQPLSKVISKLEGEFTEEFTE